MLYVPSCDLATSAKVALILLYIHLQIRRKLVIVGDGACGKTSLVSHTQCTFIPTTGAHDTSCDLYVSSQYLVVSVIQTDSRARQSSQIVLLKSDNFLIHTYVDLDH
jgi:energy-coupling factor transporter ATP-binding protein EcfA2